MKIKLLLKKFFVQALAFFLGIGLTAFIAVNYFNEPVINEIDPWSHISFCNSEECMEALNKGATFRMGSVFIKGGVISPEQKQRGVIETNTFLRHYCWPNIEEPLSNCRAKDNELTIFITPLNSEMEFEGYNERRLSMLSRDYDGPYQVDELNINEYRNERGEGVEYTLIGLSENEFIRVARCTFGEKCRTTIFEFSGISVRVVFHKKFLKEWEYIDQELIGLLSNLVLK